MFKINEKNLNIENINMLIECFSMYKRNTYIYRYQRIKNFLVGTIV